MFNKPIAKDMPDQFTAKKLLPKRQKLTAVGLTPLAPDVIAKAIELGGVLEAASILLTSRNSSSLPAGHIKAVNNIPPLLHENKKTVNANLPAASSVSLIDSCIQAPDKRNNLPSSTLEPSTASSPVPPIKNSTEEADEQNNLSSSEIEKIKEAINLSVIYPQKRKKRRKVSHKIKEVVSNDSKMVDIGVMIDKGEMINYIRDNPETVQWYSSTSPGCNTPTPIHVNVPDDVSVANTVPAVDTTFTPKVHQLRHYALLVDDEEIFINANLNTIRTQLLKAGLFNTPKTETEDKAPKTETGDKVNIESQSNPFLKKLQVKKFTLTTPANSPRDNLPSVFKRSN